jgi:hypothetical protein
MEICLKCSFKAALAPMDMLREEASEEATAEESVDRFKTS